MLCIYSLARRAPKSCRGVSIWRGLVRRHVEEREMPSEPTSGAGGWDLVQYDWSRRQCESRRRCPNSLGKLGSSKLIARLRTLRRWLVHLVLRTGVTLAYVRSALHDS
jgi:hypothetical protein